MTLGDMREIFEAAAQLYRDRGDEAAAQALKEVSSLCDDRKSMTVPAFAKLVAGHRAAG